MSLYSYIQSKEISGSDPDFQALLFSLMRKADTENLEIIKRNWPDDYNEFVLRYFAPGGCLDAEEQIYMEREG